MFIYLKDMCPLYDQGIQPSRLNNVALTHLPHSGMFEGKSFGVRLMIYSI